MYDTTPCRSHISCGVLGIMTSRTNADPNCASRVPSSSHQSPFMAVTVAVAVFTECALRASNLVKERTTRNVTHEWHISELAYACKLRTRPYRDDRRWCEVRMLARATWYATVWKWMFVGAMWYALVWKWMSACTNTICFGVLNVCSHMLYDLIWYDKRMFTCTQQNTLVWEWMFACTHMICFGVQNVCSHVLYDMIWCAKCMFAYAIQYDLVW